MIVRQTVVAGQFYPSNPVKLKNMLKEFIKKDLPKKSVKALIAPHAGYVYSGSVAGIVYSSVNIPDDIILLGPNHTGMGRFFSIMTEGIWETPFMDVPINNKLANLIIKSNGLIEDDYLAHLKEHSLEVQLPFLVEINPNISIVPITIMSSKYEYLREIGLSIGKAIRDYDKEVLIVISSDMSHYVSHDWALKNDKRAIERVLDLDSKGLFDVCRELDITMCGLSPAVVGIEASKTLGATKGELIRYATSGEVSGDYDYVVGYAGLIIY
ncbi:MAG: AmmeMemoRadiSam system protein B [Proteobacteria bacterium]|nr:AmmeMemoRadiSam system protein B [Pseudomonadota bacterium]